MDDKAAKASSLDIRDAVSGLLLVVSWEAKFLYDLYQDFYPIMYFVNYI